MDIPSIEAKNITDLNAVSEHTGYCIMDEAIVLNASSDKKYIITSGVATCFVIIIHHPKTKLALFAHVNSSKDMSAVQNKFLSFFDHIPLKELHVHIAGGIGSFFESYLSANRLRNFWESKKVTLHTELLLSRDAISINDHKDFFLCVRNVFLDYYCNKPEFEISQQDYINFIKNVVNKSEGFLFNKDRVEQDSYDENHLSNYKVEILMRETIKAYLVAKNICEKEYVDSHKFLMAQFIHNPENKEEQRVVVSLYDPYKSGLHLIGFDIEKNKLFISTDDCSSFLEAIYNETEKESITDSSLISIKSFTNKINETPNNNLSNPMI